MNPMAQRRVKAKYRVVGPKLVKVEINDCSIDPETKSLQQRKKVVEKKMFMVYFPAGHSIRVEYDELKRLGYHIRPKLVDMDTGDVVELGGDPYDFVQDADVIEPEVDTRYQIELTDQLDPEEDNKVESKDKQKVKV